MFFQIRKIVLWAKKTGLKPRVVDFEPGMLNVISGASRTGKSAIIPIIDYCLGSGKCAIPVKTIRDAVEWFGVVIETPEGQKLFARREPGIQQSTGDMMVREGREVDIPATPSRNATVDAVKLQLDQLAGLTALDFDVEGMDGRYRYRPSFRDLSAFTFQPQNIVANPNVLFYKSDTVEHREKLRTIFPYVLGAVSPSILAKRHELKQLRRDLRRKEQELDNVRRVSERWKAESLARVAEAKELGLLPPATPPPTSQSSAIALLREVAAASTTELNVTTESVGEAVAELGSLQNEESALSQDLSTLRRRHAEMSQLRSTATQYRDVLRIQQERLQLADWLQRHQGHDQSCPVCGSRLTKAEARLSDLLAALAGIEKTATQFDGIPASFDREFERVRLDMNELTERLRGVNIRRTALEQASEQARRRQYSLLMASRFLGRLEADLKTLESLGQDGDLEGEVRALRERASALEAEISEARVAQRMRNALSAINNNIGRLMPQLDSERPNDPVSLSETELTLKVLGGDRDDFLWEIGSGSNWLSYHVAAALALQQFFLTQPQSPVPSFVVFDQPSQVYFPQALARIDPDDSVIEPEWRDEDVTAVRKVFETIGQVSRSSGGRIQAIVLDHAGEQVWGNIENVHTVEDWHNGKTLVPAGWIG